MINSALLLVSLIADDGSLTINGPGLTYHGYLPQGSYALMKHRIGENTVVHPEEIGLTYKKDYFQGSALYLKDCFGHNAGALLLGPKYDFNKYFSIGFVGGVYIRQYEWEDSVPFSYTNHTVDIMPMGGVTAAITLPITKDVGIELNGMANGLVNHANFGLKFNF